MTSKNKKNNMDWVDRKFKLLELEAPPKMFNGVNLVGGTKESIKKGIKNLLKEQRDKYIKRINRIPINFLKGSISGKDEPLIEKSKIIKALKEV